MARFGGLAAAIARELRRSAVLDGELVCFDRDGRPRFYDLTFNRGDPCFVPFRVLEVDGRDLRERPLIERKRMLRRPVPHRSSRLLFADFVEARGCDFYRPCAREISRASSPSGTPRRIDPTRRCPPG
jgi:bifunctional non-homologous end joining protein LigD